MIYTVLLNPAVDVMYEAESFVPGTTVTGLASMSFPAGKGLNAAKAIAILGEPVGLAGLVPQKSRALFEEAASAFHIQTHFVDVQSDIRINATLLETKSGRVTHLNAVAFPVQKEAEAKIVSIISSLASQGDVWALLGSVPPGISPSIYNRLIAILKQAGCTVILDTSAEALTLGIEAGPHVVMPNRDEAGRLLGARCDNDDALAAQADALLAKGASAALITLGGQGAFCANQTERFFVRIPHIAAVDTVGCGDAAVAGMAAGIHRGLAFKEQCRLSAAAGMSCALHKGPGNIDRDEVLDFYERIVCEDPPLPAEPAADDQFETLGT